MGGFCKGVDSAWEGSVINGEPFLVIEHIELNAPFWNNALQGHKVEERDTARLTLGHAFSRRVDKVQQCLFIFTALVVNTLYLKVWQLFCCQTKLTITIFCVANIFYSFVCPSNGSLVAKELGKQL